MMWSALPHLPGNFTRWKSNSMAIGLVELNQKNGNVWIVIHSNMLQMLLIKVIVFLMDSAINQWLFASFELSS